VERPSGTSTAGDQRVVAGRYTLLSPLGSGGMGTVWRARDGVLAREVAVKEVVFPHGLSDEDRDVLRERTRREARAAARLDHPSAVTVYDVVEEHGSPFLVMELVEARTLADVVRTEGPLTPEQAGEVGLAVLGALQAAHRQGIVHRDVKPGNVLLRTDETGTRRVVLTDFGIATSAGDASITSTGMLLGSPSYIAPERARGRQPGPASDLWSLGATLFTAVEGRPPYDAGEPLATVTAVVTGEHAPFVAAGPLEPVISGLLERDPAQRFDAETARVMLQQVVRGTAAGAASPPRPAPAPARREADRTAALPVGAVRSEVAAAERDDSRPPARPARPAPTGGGSRRRPAVLALALAALFLVATAVGGWALLTSGGGSPSAGPQPGADTPADAPQPDEDAAEPEPSEPPDRPADDVDRPEGVPAGWEAYTHPTQGWTLFHPPSYEVSDRGTLKQFRDPNRRYTLRVDYTDTPKQSAVQAWEEYSPVLAGRLAEYSERRLEPLEYRGWDAADLEFTYSDSGTDLHVLDRTFVVDGRGYALYWQTAEDRFADSLAEFERLAAAFVPAG
jgi:eukaryotic-like serine/threonine-protein kinase